MRRTLGSLQGYEEWSKGMLDSRLPSIKLAWNHEYTPLRRTAFSISGFMFGQGRVELGNFSTELIENSALQGQSFCHWVHIFAWASGIQVGWRATLLTPYWTWSDDPGNLYKIAVSLACACNLNVYTLVNAQFLRVVKT